MNSRSWFVTSLFAAVALQAFSSALAQPASDASLAAPDPSVRWSGDDYQTEVTLISTGKAPLPTHGSPQGRAVLARMTSEEDFKALYDDGAYLRGRIRSAGMMGKAVGKLMTLYLDAEKQGQDVHVELASMVARRIQVAPPMLQLMNQFFETEDKTPANLQKEAAARRDTGADTAEMFGLMARGAFQESGFTHADRMAVLTALHEAVTQAAGFLAAANRSKLRDYLNPLVGAHHDAAEDRLLQDTIHLLPA